MTDFARFYERLAESSLRWCAETLVLALVMTSIVMVATRWRRFGPAARHALWLVILIKMVTPPLVYWPWSRSWEMPTQIEVPIASETLSPETPFDTEQSLNIDDEELVVSQPILNRHVATPRPEPRPVVRDWSAILNVSARVGFGVWLLGSLVLITANGRRILRFHLLTRDAEPAPQWLVEEASKIAARVGVCLPPIQVSSRLASPLLWCLGSPVLLLPVKLVDSLGTNRWRGILAHELAHIRRGDPWVSRLELFAAVVWWWNPLFFWIRRRLDAEAELACDAWVVATLPRERLTYAESLIEVCSTLPLVRNPAPSLGVAGAGRFFERRLTMILTDRVSCRLSAPGLLAAAFMAVLALPSWTQATPTVAPKTIVATNLNQFTSDDDDDDEKLDKAKQKAERAEKAAKAKRAEKAEKSEKPEKPEKKKAKPAKKAKTSESNDKLDVIVEKALGPDFEKKMEAMGEKIGKEMEAKFGPGSDFEKKMEVLGKEMEAKFGPGSEFEKSMETLGKEMEAKFGPGSNFAEEMKTLGAKVGKDLEGKLGPELKKKLENVSKATKGEMKAEKPKKAASKAARAKQLEAQIKELTKQLKKLQADDDEEEEDDDEDNK
jgi:bla regulator protein BlaR1